MARQLLIARSQPTALLQMTDQVLDDVAVPVVHRAGRPWLRHRLAPTLRNHRLNALPTQLRADRRTIIASVSHEHLRARWHRDRFEARDELRAVVALSRAQVHQQRPVANQVPLRRKTAPAAPEGLLGSVGPGISARFFCHGGSPLGAHRGRINKPGFQVQRAVVEQLQLKRLQDAVNRAISAPSPVAVIDGLLGAKALRQIAPGDAGAEHPEDAV